MRHVARSAIVASLLALAAPASAATLDEARGAIRDGDTAKALKLLQPLVEAGDADAELMLADIYARGTGVREDPAKAMSWLREAANQGNALAQARLFMVYDRGRGAPRDPVRAYMWIYLVAREESRFRFWRV